MLAHPRTNSFSSEMPRIFEDSSSHNEADPPATPEEVAVEGYKSDAQIIREGGWRSMHSFMRSYGLQPTPEGYEEAKIIIDGFRRMDAELSDDDTWHDDMTARRIHVNPRPYNPNIPHNNRENSFGSTTSSNPPNTATERITPMTEHPDDLIRAAENRHLNRSTSSSSLDTLGEEETEPYYTTASVPTTAGNDYFGNYGAAREYEGYAARMGIRDEDYTPPSHGGVVDRYEEGTFFEEEEDEIVDDDYEMEEIDAQEEGEENGGEEYESGYDHYEAAEQDYNDGYEGGYEEDDHY